MLEQLLKLLDTGQDSALLRFGLGSTYLKQKEPVKAMEHLKKAVEMDPSYSAAWKLYGKALRETGHLDSAIAAFEKGIVVAQERGDVQAVKEMEIFLKRVQQTQ